jgi:hypothetical protein
VTPRPLAGTSAGVFDAYGTLSDFTSAARRCGEPLDDAMAQLGCSDPALRGLAALPALLGL